MLNKDNPVTNRWLLLNQQNLRDLKMSQFWAQPVGQWVVRSRRLSAQSTILDYGCGYFDVGQTLMKHYPRVDGFDIDSDALGVARNKIGSYRNVTLFKSFGEVPKHTYDIVIVNSVIQYFESLSNLFSILQNIQSILIQSPRSFVLISDILPIQYHVLLDGLNSLITAYASGLAKPMARHLWESCRNFYTHPLLKIDPSQFMELADRAGFDFELLQENLTPSPYRYSCILKFKI